MKARQTLTLLKSPPHVEVQRLDGESDDHYEKRCESIRALGPRWLGHPAYVFQPRHSVYANVYRPARKPFLDAIKVRAMQDRINNEDHQDAERQRTSLVRPTT